MRARKARRRTSIRRMPSRTSSALVELSRSIVYRPTPRVRLESIEFWIAAAGVFFIPFNLLRLSFAYFTLADMLLCLSLFLRLCCGSFPLRPFGRGSIFWVVGLLLLLGGLLASSIIMGDLGRGMIVSFQYLFAMVFMPCAILGRSPKQTLGLVAVFCASMFVICAFGIYLIHIDGQRNTAFVSGNGRLRSFLERENALAALIALTVPLMIWLRNIRRLPTPVMIVGLASMVYATMLTGSNTGSFAIMVALMTSLLLTARLRMLVTGAVLFVLIGVWMIQDGYQYLPGVFQKRVLAAVESGDIDEAGTFLDRYNLMVESLEIGKHTLLIGLGPDQYREVSYWYLPVHNTYMLIWTEGGAIALAGLATVMLAWWTAAIGAVLLPGGRLHAAPAIASIFSFMLLINAAPHIYARFWTAPILLGVAISTAFVRASTAPSLRDGGSVAPQANAASTR